MTDQEIETRENVAQTVRDIMTELDHHDDIPNILKGATNQPWLVAVPNGREVVDLTDKHRAAAEFLKPARRKGTAHMADLDSLINWADRFSGETSVLYANPVMNAPTLTCIADYHQEGDCDVYSEQGDPTARHCHHRAVYDFPLSEEWKAWLAVTNMAQAKDDFGEFIEANAKDIMNPTPAVLAGKVSKTNEPWENRLIETAQQIEGRFGQLTQLLALSKRFQVYETADLKVVSNRDTGEGEIQFLNEHKDADGKPLKLPNLIIIAIPVFYGGAPYRMAVRFRYRKQGSEVRFVLSIYNPEKVFRAAFDEAVMTATAQTGLPTFFGRPES